MLGIKFQGRSGQVHHIHDVKNKIQRAGAGLDLREVDVEAEVVLAVLTGADRG